MQKAWEMRAKGGQAPVVGSARPRPSPPRISLAGPAGQGERGAVNDMKKRVRIVVALACAALAMLCSAAYAQSVREESERVRGEALERYGGEVTTLVVAARPLAAGEVIGEGDVEEREWLSELVPEGAYGSLEDVVGQTLSFPVAKGLPLTETGLSAGEDALEVPSGMVAVSLERASALGLPDGVGTGATVVAYEAGEGGVRIVAESARVLALGQAEGQVVRGSALTLAVEPACVADLMRCAAEGTLRLVLPADDVEASELGEVESAPAEVAPVDGDAAGGAGDVPDAGGASAAGDPADGSAGGEGAADGEAGDGSVSEEWEEA